MRLLRNISDRFNSLLEGWAVKWPAEATRHLTLLHLSGYILGLADANEISHEQWEFLDAKLWQIYKYTPASKIVDLNAVEKEQ